MNWNDFLILARLSVTDPERGASAVISLNPPLAARWMLVAVAVLAGVVMAFGLPVLAGRGADMPSPFMAAALQGGANVLAVGLMSTVGRLFGGKGSFEDALLLVGWLQLMMVGVQLVQLVVMLVLPPLGAPVMALAVALFFWMLTGFICALHGFGSRLVVLMGVFASLFAVAFVISFVLILLGIELPGLDDV